MEHQCAAALGFFDGVHRGHLTVLRCASDYAKSHGMESAAVTFDRSPREAVTGVPAPLLCTPEDRVRIMREYAGIDRVVVLPFDEAMRRTEAADFLRRYVFDGLKAGFCAAGYDYRFGAGGQGDAELLRTLCAARGIPCGIVGRLEDGAEKISSTRIREAVAAGDMETAEALLGRPFSFSGEIVHGKALGRRLGFPTMNIPVPKGLILPAAGVYTCRILLDGVSRPAVCNVAHGEKPLCEAHVFHYAADVYGSTARAELLHFLRPMRKFASWDALAAQVEQDKIVAQNWFSSL